MELLGWTVYLVAVPAVIFAGVSKGGFGSGAAFASSSILALVLAPGAALGIMLPLLMLIDVSSLGPYWRRWSWADARLLILSGLPGVVLGAVFYDWADPDAIRFLIGAVCLAFVAWTIATKSGRLRLGQRPMGRAAGSVAGLVVGFTSFVSHAGGPAAAVYLLGRKLDKTTFQATTVLVFWALNLAKAGVYAGMGIFTRDTLILALALAPFAVLGTWIGVRLHHAVPERLFFGVTYVLLTVTGSKLIWDALT
ncbi:sulfite exporter TauE/SafE family protein [Roseivivax isoporae]|uniref:Probable membrane transporter protein n=1 Tax=Roseivivax isoporae LMG 25204 TaxID=1449351 RepID=X7FCZ6_9RHOB|nr:sulfite exporter TauE/SafE family protein [Roseivivax isoporae]ETX29956.1 membrane protein [Roseivivax isoporae LMG 25204]